MSMLCKDFERIYLILQVFTDGHASLWTVLEKLSVCPSGSFVP